MEFNEFSCGKESKGKCRYCRRWVHFSDLELGESNSLEEVACPHCGKTGEEIHKLQDQAKRAYED